MSTASICSAIPRSPAWDAALPLSPASSCPPVPPAGEATERAAPAAAQGAAAAVAVPWAPLGSLTCLAAGCLVGGWPGLVAVAAAVVVAAYALAAATAAEAPRTLDGGASPAPASVASEVGVARSGSLASLADELAAPAPTAAALPRPQRPERARWRALRAQLEAQTREWLALEASMAGQQQAHASERERWQAREAMLERRIDDAQAQLGPCLHRERLAAERLRHAERNRNQMAAQLGVQAGESCSLRERFGELERTLAARDQRQAQLRQTQAQQAARLVELEAALAEQGEQAACDRRAWQQERRGKDRAHNATQQQLTEAHRQLAEQALLLRAAERHEGHRRVRSA